MAAFPTSGNTLKTARDSLRNEIKKLQALVTQASNWVEALERDRLSLPTAAMTEAAYDASLLSTAQTFLAQLQAETSTTSTAGLNLRVKNTLSIQAVSIQFTVASQAAMVALTTADLDDRAIRTDLNQTFRLAMYPASIASNWVLV